MFAAIGVVVGVYAVYGAWSGQVFAKSGPWGRMVRRDESPGYFWSVVVTYGVLSAALVWVF